MISAIFLVINYPGEPSATSCFFYIDEQRRVLPINPHSKIGCFRSAHHSTVVTRTKTSKFLMWIDR